MAYGLGDIVAKATSSLPLPRLGRWEIQVKNEDVYKQAPDDSRLSGNEDVYKQASDDSWLSDITNTIREATDFFDNIKETASDIFSFWSGDEEAFDYKAIANFDSLIDCSIQKDSMVVTNPIEQGSFRAVNKVMKPTTAKVTLAKGGFYKGIEVCLEALNELQESTKKCRIVTPFGVTKDLNLFKFNYTYKRDTGSYLLIANLEFTEIREGSVVDTAVKNPFDANINKSGTRTLTTELTKAVKGWF